MSREIQFPKGTRVRFEGKPEWGVGQFLEDSNSQELRIFFEGIGDKRFASASAGKWVASTILTARRQLSWPVEAGNESDCLCC